MRKYFIIIFCIFLFPFNTYSNERSLKVGVSQFDPPFIMWSDTHHLYGFDIAMILFVCKSIKAQCSFIPFERNKLIDAVASGKVDMAVSDLAITRTRAEKVLFSIPYLINTTQIIGLNTAERKKFNLSLLDNKTIGMTDSEYESQIKALNIINPTITLFNEDDDLIKALNEKKIDFALVDAYTATYWSDNSSNRIKNFGCPKTFELTAGIAINLRNLFLQEQINQALTLYRSSHDFVNDYHDNLLHF